VTQWSVPGGALHFHAMPWTSQIDVYCERTDFAFWSEPLNALTNLGFLVAAALLWRAQAAAASPVDVRDRALPALIAAIGVASFLFHTLATVWAALADKLAILAFAAYFLFLFLLRATRLGTISALAAAGVFAALSYAFPKLVPAGAVAGSAGYLPYLVALLLIATYLWRSQRAAARAVLGATLLFVLALVLRTADAAVCRSIPLGTHFLWHLLNAVVLYILARTLSIRLKAPP
jgi:Ceramidase